MPLLDANGNIVEWFGTARDITERRRGEETLARSPPRPSSNVVSTRRFCPTRRIWSTSSSVDHRFTYANDALLTIWGKTSDEAIGKTCLELGYEPWHAAMHDSEIDEVIATDRVRFAVKCRSPGRRADGSTTTFSFRFSPHDGKW